MSMRTIFIAEHYANHLEIQQVSVLAQQTICLYVAVWIHRAYINSRNIPSANHVSNRCKRLLDNVGITTAEANLYLCEGHGTATITDQFEFTQFVSTSNNASDQVPLTQPSAHTNAPNNITNEHQYTWFETPTIRGDTFSTQSS